MSKFGYKFVINDTGLPEAFEVRKHVFVQEQGISEELVFDAHDKKRCIPFYKSYGFNEFGLPFWETGIKHIKMRKQF